MNISGQPSVSLLQSVLDAASARHEMAVAVVDKAQEIQQQQGEAIVDLLEQAGTPLLDAYA
jgi:hypothetical protein